ncbi:MAG: type II secretion system F family protein [Clostridia bacterium]|nr:type II secretion system F family protein [Clostridia bacterium]MDD4047766.1 type II secretion system F family protein [Clostridia bacterium]
METFYYRVRDKRGREIEGNKIGININQIAVSLREEGNFIVEIQEKAPLLKNLFMKFTISRQIDNNKMAMFCRQLAVILETGVPIITGLRQIIEQETNSSLRFAFNNLIDDILAGKTLSEAASKQEKLFGKIFIHMVTAGEMGGVLDSVLVNLAEHYEREQQIKENIKTAMLYPLMILFVALTATVFVLVYIIPKFVTVLQDMDVKLFIFTKILIHISAIINNYWSVIVFIFCLLVFGIKNCIETTWGRRMKDSLILKIPGYGKFIHKVIMSRFTRILGVLMNTGVPITLALEIVAKAVNNVVFEDVILQSQQSIKNGDTITSTFEKSSVFPRLVVQMMQIGEETGNIDKMLLKVSSYYEREVNEMSERLAKILEPFLLIVIGGIVGFIILSIYVPIFSVMSNI